MTEPPRLIINGEPVRPEDLGRNLSPSVQLRLSISKDPYVPPEPLPPKAPSRTRVEALPPRTLVVVLVLLGLGLAALFLLLQ
ncbi:hypothetical protein JQX13_44475 [Archangium violaceum]|uniref:hypothetical protein n=1 Tax=Archangium violaceum TaxID=83451 RepID=UPI00193B7CB4|nr:hypothetical protein [Archangium violaceum]QRK07040.1 hypothetical protein JQX13_44475 [Archangium violaceum]